MSCNELQVIVRHLLKPSLSLFCQLGPSSNASRNDALEPMNVFPGQTFSLSCGVDESPDLSFYWLKDGREMPGQNRPKLIFNPFRPEDEGYYSCRVIGQERDMLTRLVYLRVGKY